MAEDKDQSVEQDQSETAGVTVKRRLKTPSLKSDSETVRERSERHRKLQESTEPSRPGFLGLFWSGFTWPLRMLGRQLAKLGRFRAVRFIGRIVFPRYFRNSWRELQQVTWPNRRQSWRLTYAVIVFSIIFGVIVFVVDFVLDKLFKELILK